MERPLGFTDIIYGYRAALVEGGDTDEMEMLFAENTREWADAMISLHSMEYGISPYDRALLWESVKKANLEILENLEIEISALENFMDFYLAYINQSMQLDYFRSTPRLAEIIRKNVKRKTFSEEVLPQMENGRLKTVQGRKIKMGGHNPPVFDSWTEVWKDNYPETFRFLIRVAHDDNTDTPAELAARDNMDVETRRRIWEEITAALVSKTESEWQYDSVPTKTPQEDTRRFFRTTLNWFLVNFLVQSEEYGEDTAELINDLEQKESYNYERGLLPQQALPGLMESFRSHGPSDFYRDYNVGSRGMQFGALFDKVANHIYNRIFFPELARYVASDWGIER